MSVNRDFLLYGKARCSENSAGAATILITRPGDGDREISFWLGSPDGGSTFATGSSSLAVHNEASPQPTDVVELKSGLDYENIPVEFCLQYDSKFGTVTAWFREASGHWKFGGRLACTWFDLATMQAQMTANMGAGDWLEFDYLTAAYPNLVLIGDSIAEGATLYSPDLADELTNDDGCWPRHALLYPGSRNNLIVNKGVGGNSSGHILTRISDVTATGARIALLQASANDYTSGISQETRTQNIQDSINAITTAGAEVVLLNAMYGTADRAPNLPDPLNRDYMKLWWDEESASMTGVSTLIDIMQPVRTASFFQRDELTETDNIHPNIAGYMAIGEYISSQRRAPEQISASPALWTPLNMATVPQIYLDAEDSEVTDVSGFASAISNLGAMGADGDFVQTTAGLRPSILPAELNGKRVLSFDGTNDVMQGASAAQKDLFRNSGAGWGFVVYKKRAASASGSAGRQLFFCSTASSGTRLGALAHSSTAGQQNKPQLGARRLDADSFVTMTAASAVSGSYSMQLFRVDYTSGLGDIYVDGAVSVSNATFVSAGSTSDTAAATAIFLGASTAAGGAPADMDFAAMVMSKENPPLDDIDKLFGWAAHNYGLAANLPSDHPYKTDPPYA